MTVPFSQKISGNTSYFGLLFPFWEGLGSSLCPLLLGDCAFDVSRGQQFSQRKHLVTLAVLLCLASVSYWLQAQTELISHDGEFSLRERSLVSLQHVAT